MKTMLKIKYGLLLFGMMLAASCSTDVSDEVNKISDNIAEKNAELDARLKLIEMGMGTFEGLWNFGIDSASPDEADNLNFWTPKGDIMVKEDTVSFALPEERIIDVFMMNCANYPNVTWADSYPDEPFFSDYKSINSAKELDSLYGQWLCSKTDQKMRYYLDGLTIESYYMSGSNVYNTFMDEKIYGERANIPLPEYGDYSYMISKDDVKYRIDLSINNAKLVFDRTTSVWAIQLPIKRIALINLQTGQQENVEFVDHLRLFMSTYSKKG